jgi:putative SOS response-associated peptidase YedK
MMMLPSYCGSWLRKGLVCYTIITTECNELMQPIHDRMPVILAPEAWEACLDPGFRKNEVLLFLLKPFGTDRMQAWPVSAAVGKVTNQGEELFCPLISGSAGGLF